MSDVKVLKCPSNHKLKKVIASGRSSECISCDQTIPIFQTIYECKKCNFDLCSICYHHQLQNKMVNKTKSLRETMAIKSGDFIKRAKQKVINGVNAANENIHRQREYKQNEKNIESEQIQKGYQLSISQTMHSDDNKDEWNMINIVDMAQYKNYKPQKTKKHHRSQSNYINYDNSNNYNMNQKKKKRSNSLQNSRIMEETMYNNNNNMDNNTALLQGDNIEFNSDPESEDDIESHTHYGQIIATTKDEIRIKIEDGQINSYFIDEITIKNVAEQIQNKQDFKENKHENIHHNVDQYVDQYVHHNMDHNVHHNVNNNNVPHIVNNNVYSQQYIKQNVDRPKILSLTETLRTTGIQKPYWWDNNNNNNNNNNTQNIVITWDSNKTICNEIISKFYAELNDMAGNDIKDTEIYSIQNIKLWKRYQNYRNTISDKNDNMYEQYVWYGTNITRQVNDICNLGFNNVNAILFTKTSEYHYNLCLQQKKSNRRKNNYQYLFLCRIYDDQSNGNTFEATNGDQIYPQFLIRFRIIKDPIYPPNNRNTEIQRQRPVIMDAPQMRQQSQSNPPAAMSELQLLQREIPGVALARSNPLPMPPKPPPKKHHATWICTVCTFAENLMYSDLCSVCNSPRAGKIKCDHCTAANDQNATECSVCGQRISINNNNNNNNDNNNNNLNVQDMDLQQTPDMMDPEVLKHIEEEFKYHAQNNSLQMDEMEAMDVYQNDDNDNNLRCPLRHELTAFTTTHSGFVCDICGKTVKIRDKMWGCRPCNYDLCASCYMINTNYNNDDLQKQKQFWDDLKLAQQLQQAEQNGMDAFDGIDQIIRRYRSHDQFEQDEEKEFNELYEDKPLPPIRKHQPVHGTQHEIMTLYHITSAESAQKIKESNKMIRGSKGMFGGGIYFAETQKDANYKAEHRGWLVTCKVYVGRCKRVENANGGKFTFGSLYKSGFDSVWAPNGSGKGKCERVVYNWDQVIIKSVEKYNGD